MSRPCMPPGRWGAALSLTPVGKGAINKGILWKVSRERRAEYHGKMEKDRGAHRGIPGCAGQVAGGGGADRRDRRGDRIAVPHRRQLCHPNESGASVDPVPAAGAGAYYCGAVPCDQGGGQGYQRCHRIGALWQECAGAAGAGHLYFHGADPPGRRQCRTRGRGTADRRGDRL